MRTAHSPPAVPLGQALFFLFSFFIESNLRSGVSRFEAGYFLPFVVFVVVVAFRQALSPFL